MVSTPPRAIPEDGAGPPDPWEPNFSEDTAFALGVEEELMLVDESNSLADRGKQAIQSADTSRGEIDRELFQAMVESRSDPAANANAAIAVLRESRRALLESGSRIMGAGAHPNAAMGEGEIQDTPRYKLIERSLRGILRTPICGQHIHIGMPDAESAVRAHNGMRTYVPLVNALAANSAFWFGEDSGLASARTVIFRSYPRAAMAPGFEDFDHFCRVTRQICKAGALDDYTQIWWDVRIHPLLGTIEVRAADTQTDLRRAGAIAAFVHCLAIAEARRDQVGTPSREALAESAFQATRHGLAANLLDRACDLLPAPEMARRSLEVAAPVAAELGCERELGHIERILDEGCGADVQRRVHEERGMPGLLDYLVAETARLD
jgi:carboxylate-amine ligase